MFQILKKVCVLTVHTWTSLTIAMANLFCQSDILKRKIFNWKTACEPVSVDFLGFYLMEWAQPTVSCSTIEAGKPGLWFLFPPCFQVLALASLNDKLHRTCTGRECFLACHLISRCLSQPQKENQDKRGFQRKLDLAFFTWSVPSTAPFTYRLQFAPHREENTNLLFTLSLEFQSTVCPVLLPLKCLFSFLIIEKRWLNKY